VKHHSPGACRPSDCNRQACGIGVNAAENANAPLRLQFIERARVG